MFLSLSTSTEVMAPGHPICLLEAQEDTATANTSANTDTITLDFFIFLIADKFVSCLHNEEIKVLVPTIKKKFF